MIFLETIAVAFAMFSAIPVPQPQWNAQNMRYAMCAFPLIGAVCGLCWWGWTVFAGWLGASALLRGAGYCLLPVVITGGIHLDGYADTCDALASYGDAARRQEILKDPHCGAFAVIRLISWFIAYFALCVSFDPAPAALVCMGLGFVLERALSGLAVATFPLARDTGLAHTFATAADKTKVKRILTALAAALAAAMAAIGGIMGAVMAAAALLAFWNYYHTAVRKFGGLSGDLAGWFLQRAELWMLAAAVFCQLAGEVLAG